MDRIETAEIADAELDAVAGGLVGDVVSTAVATVDEVAPVGSVTGTLGQVNGTLASTTGVNLQPAANLATSL